MVTTSIKIQLFEEIIQYFSHRNIDNDQLFISNGISWKNYENLLEYLENFSHFRVVYDCGTLQIMSPSSRHEMDKKTLGMLVENYCLEMGIRFYALGSTTFKSQNTTKGIEPDQCYCLGSKKEIPDLAIEVIMTSGGIDSLAIYQALGVAEVWFWKNKKLSVYCRQNENYIQTEKSQLLPNLNLELLASYLEWDEPFDALLDFRNKIRQA